MVNHTDIIDEMNAAWKRELPELDPSPLEIVGRVIVIAEHLERSVNAALEPFGLSLGQFDILATLRRQGPEGKMTPTQLMKSVMLSSGGMTNRIDRLEQAELIRREEDPDDRRGVVVGLTTKGRELIDKATAARFAEAKESLPPFNAKDTKELTRMLRNWFNHL
ncbi:MAG: MarR family transcriptional regulator [Planctomycetes bacterium]|nr:MarR family transcriptional regulator [Planctomycetota bacterium]